MEHLPFALFALLPLGLFSLFEKGRHRHTAGFGFLAALAPMIASGISSLIGHKKQQSAAKQAEEQRRLEAQQADTLAKQSWEAEQNSPGAQAARYKNTLQLGRLAGKMGGLDKLPPSMRNYYQTQRTMPTYGGTSSYVPTAKKGGGVWDFLGEASKAVSYLDPSQFKSAPKANTLSKFGNVGSSDLGASASPQGSVDPLAGLLGRLKG
jgi:hypothetical protein